MPGTHRPLLLRPLRSHEAPGLAALLDRPGLKRRGFAPARTERQPIEWSARRRTFGVFAGEALIGAVELVADEDDPGNWELGLSLTTTGGIGGRCAAAVLFYAFEQLGAETVWCWARADNAPIARLTRRFGFVSSHSIRQPGGKRAVVYELDAASWDAHRRQVILHYLDRTASVMVCDDVACWRGDGFGFMPDGAEKSVSLPIQAYEPPDQVT